MTGKRHAKALLQIIEILGEARYSIAGPRLRGKAGINVINRVEGPLTFLPGNAVDLTVWEDHLGEVPVQTKNDAGERR